jgi:hypothetical protein
MLYSMGVLSASDTTPGSCCPRPLAALTATPTQSPPPLRCLLLTLCCPSSPASLRHLPLPFVVCRCLRCPANHCSPSLYYDTNAAIHHYLIVYCRLPCRFLVTSCCSMHGTPTNSSTYTAFSAIPPSAQPAAFLSRMTLSERKGDDATHECMSARASWGRGNSRTVRAVFVS